MKLLLFVVFVVACPAAHGGKTKTYRFGNLLSTNYDNYKLNSRGDSSVLSDPPKPCTMKANCNCTDAAHVMPCRPTGNILILSDCSLCFADEWKTIIDWLRTASQEITESFLPNSNYALMQFGTDGQANEPLYSFDEPFAFGPIDRTLDGISFCGRGAYLDRALANALSHFGRLDSVEAEMPSFLVVLTNGNSHQSVKIEDVKRSVADLQNKNVAIIPVAIDMAGRNDTVFNLLSKKNADLELFLRGKQCIATMIETMKLTTQCEEPSNRATQCDCEGERFCLQEKGQPGDPIPAPPGDKGPPGLDGVDGLNGPPGPPGPKGMRGKPGTDGPKGERNHDGQPGPMGPLGELGPDGDDGSQGPRGDPGKAGNPGDKGNLGDVGVKGNKGDPGIKGIKGIPGSKGTKGIKAPRGMPGPDTIGPQGDRGPDGTDGSPGPEGPHGPNGDDGPPGCSGCQGIPGDVGKKGAPGVPGLRGKDGAVGPSGFQGLPGRAGKPGSQGDAGDPGAPGSSGIHGASGQPGRPGLKGGDGPMGPQGPSSIAPGPQGPRGYPGEQGLDGLPGSDGMDGAQGVRGAPGRVGPKGFTGPPAHDRRSVEVLVWREIQLIETAKEGCGEPCCETCYAYVPPTNTCNDPIDLVFLVDGSGSILSRHFDSIKKWIITILQTFDQRMVDDKTRVTIIQFSDNVTVELQEFMCNLATTANCRSFDDISTRINNIVQEARSTSTWKGIKYLASDFKTFDVDSYKSLITITDGTPTDEENESNLQEVHTIFDQMIAVSVGDDVNQEFLQGLASTDRLISISDFNALENSIEELTSYLCETLPEVINPILPPQEQWPVDENEYENA